MRRSLDGGFRFIAANAQSLGKLVGGFAGQPRCQLAPGASIPLALLFTGVFVLVVGAPAWMPFEAGFLGGYLFYDSLHYYVHHHRPKSRWGKRLRELHMRHHFQDDTTGFGVSAPWWDHVFGTATLPSRRP